MSGTIADHRLASAFSRTNATLTPCFGDNGISLIKRMAFNAMSLVAVVLAWLLGLPRPIVAHKDRVLFAKTGLAATASFLVHVSVFGRVFVSFRTMSHKLASGATPHVLQVSNRIKVVWANTKNHAAEMVKLQTFGNGADHQFIGDPVGSVRSLEDGESAVALPVTLARPKPTRAEVRSKRRQWAVFIDVGPESLLVANVVRRECHVGHNIAVGIPAVVMAPAPAASGGRFLAVGYKASGNVGRHRESSFLGVMGQDVSASLPSNYTRNEVFA